MTIYNNIIVNNTGPLLIGINAHSASSDYPVYSISCGGLIDIVDNKIICNSIYGYSPAGIIGSASNIIGNFILINSTNNYPWFIQDLCGICCASGIVSNNTIIVNILGDWERGYGIYCCGVAAPQITNNIVCGSMDYGVYSADETSVPTISCNNVFVDENNNYGGYLSDQTGINGNISMDPIFCDPEIGEYTLHVQSPCLPGNHPDGLDCGLIGALGQGCDYIATLLQGYQTTVNESVVAIRWTLAEYIATKAFHILRAEYPDGEYVEIQDMHIMRESSTYVFSDRNCEPGQAYRYRIYIEDELEHRILFETNPITVPQLPLILYQNYPNPFNPATSIRYYLPENSSVSIEIYDISGKKIAILLNKEQEKGSNKAQWNGRDQHGNSVASGVYIYRLTAGRETISKKMILMK